MKKQELQTCLDQIAPNEKLILSTLEKMEAAQSGKRYFKRVPSRKFIYRTTAVACALVLSIGVWKIMDSYSEPMNISLYDAENESTPTASTLNDTTNKLISRNFSLDQPYAEIASEMAEKAQGNNYLIITADLKEVNSKDQVAWAVLTPNALIESNISDQEKLNELHQSPLITVRIGDSMQDKLDDMAGTFGMVLLIESECDKADCWVVSGYQPVGK